jgi:hypothetical protein
MNRYWWQHAARGGQVAGLLLGLLFLLLPGLAPAATRAWLDRNSIEQGESVTLNIQTDQSGAPDYTPLQADFALGPPYRSRDSRGAAALFGIALTPRRAGTLAVPALQVGGERTQPMVLRVLPAGDSTPRGDVFIDTRVDAPSPYVQQAVGISVKLHYATPLLSGELSQDAPQGASLQRIGEDVTSTREIGGRRYQVVERRYLLVPERSGPMALPPARFRGQGAAGFFDDFFGNNRSLAAQGPARVLQVQAQPDGAPQPWLPLRSLALRYVAAPTQAHTGQALELEVEAVAQGVTASQFPEIPVPQPRGAQVFAERAQTEERFVDGSPQLTVRRRFAVVPSQPGLLQVPGLRMDWWDTATDTARGTRLPDLQLEVEGGVAAGDLPAPVDASPVQLADDAVAASAPSRQAWPWPWLALAFALAWLLTLVWALHLRAGRAEGVPDGAMPEAGAGPRATLPDLRRKLDAGGLEEVVGVLRHMHAPPLTDLEQVLGQLDDAGQRQALEDMRRALWAGDGDPAAARARLRAAFRNGPRWRAAPATATDPLPPLYPPSPR